MIKRLKQGLVALLLSATPILAQDVSRVVQLEGREYTNFEMQNNTSYVGTLPTKRVNDLKIEMTQLEEPPKDLIDDTYTKITGSDLGGWGTNCSLSNVQLENLESLGYLGQNNSLSNSIVYGDTNRQGFQTNSDTDNFTNNIFANLDFSIGIWHDAGGGRNISDNFFGWNYVAIRTGGGANIGDEKGEGNNIFYRNTENIDAEDLSYSPLVVEGNWWYDKEGWLLETEEEIFDTINYNTNALQTKATSNFIDVIPFKSYHPWQNPYTIDSDGDGVTDNQEITWGTDPYDSESVPDLPLSVGLAGLALAGAGIYAGRKNGQKKTGESIRKNV